VVNFPVSVLRVLNETVMPRVCKQASPAAPTCEASSIIRYQNASSSKNPVRILNGKPN
jgi:hypothetical protein